MDHKNHSQEKQHSLKQSDPYQQSGKVGPGTRHDHGLQGRSYLRHQPPLKNGHVLTKHSEELNPTTPLQPLQPTLRHPAASHSSSLVIQEFSSAYYNLRGCIAITVRLKCTVLVSGAVPLSIPTRHHLAAPGHAGLASITSSPTAFTLGCRVCGCRHSHPRCSTLPMLNTFVSKDCAGVPW